MTSNATTAPVLEARDLSKTFGDRAVLKGVTLEILAGQVHGLLGENGSGKSTLIKILSGFHAPDVGGELVVRGTPVGLPLKVTDPARLGIGFVHQELAIFASGTVLENIRVGRFATAPGWRIPWRRERRLVRDWLARFELRLDPDTPVSQVGPIERAMIAIIRALDQCEGSGQAVLVLDEPTVYLPNDGVAQLFAAIRELASRGIGVLFVTHRLEEVRAITDRVTVLRDGERVLTARTDSVTDNDLIESILGFALAELYPHQHDSVGAPAFEARDISGRVVRNVSLRVAAGEIVGVTGLVGMGFDELPYLLFGASEPTGGSIRVQGEEYEVSQFTPRAALAAGIGMLPANRANDGAVTAASVADNMTLLTLGTYFRGGRLRHREELADTRHLMEVFDVRPRDPRRTFEAFSGGNQQKALLAKWLTRHPPVLLMHEPTQGVDIGARRDIFAKIREAADGGMAILIASTEYEDLVNLCDRVLVFRHGRVVSELAGTALTEDHLLDQVLRSDASAPDARTTLAS
jgi:ribose transport system ATP-binding protein